MDERGGLTTLQENNSEQEAAHPTENHFRQPQRPRQDGSPSAPRCPSLAGTWLLSIYLLTRLLINTTLGRSSFYPSEDQLWVAKKEVVFHVPILAHLNNDLKLCDNQEVARRIIKGFRDNQTLKSSASNDFLKSA